MTETASRCSASEKLKVKAFKFDTHSKRLRVLDQTKLPKDIEYVDVPDSESGRNAIRSMIVRGAPCIAAVGCLSIIAEFNREEFLKEERTPGAVLQVLEEKLNQFVNTRPTAVNLKNSLNKMNEYAKRFASESEKGRDVIRKLTSLCSTAIKDGETLNRRLGDHGAAELLKRVDDRAEITVLTHCNTGSLATVGYGTALGVIRSLHKQKKLKQAYCTETRPYNQGSRLTAWEFVREEIPATLIADNMVAYLMETRSIDAVIVGADCVAANGDTANKIGTLQLAVLSKHYKVPFYVAAPSQTFDLSKQNKGDMRIEERPGKELRRLGDIHLAPDEIKVWNPSFDVTPPSYITSIITEFGVCDPNKIENFLSELPNDDDLVALY